MRCPNCGGSLVLNAEGSGTILCHIDEDGIIRRHTIDLDTVLWQDDEEWYVQCTQCNAIFDFEFDEEKPDVVYEGRECERIKSIREIDELPGFKLPEVPPEEREYNISVTLEELYHLQEKLHPERPGTPLFRLSVKVEELISRLESPHEWDD